MATQGTARRGRKADPLQRVERAAGKAIDRELKRVDTLTNKIKRDSAARLTELDHERERIVAMREALGLDGEPKRRGRPPRAAANSGES